MTIKTALSTMITANSNSQWAYVQEGLLSEGYLHQRYGGLNFRRTFCKGAYYQNFIVLLSRGKPQ